MKKLFTLLFLSLLLSSCLRTPQGLVTKVHISPSGTENLYAVIVEITQPGPAGKTILNSKFKCVAGDMNELHTYTNLNHTTVKINVHIPKDQKKKDEKISVRVAVLKGSTTVSTSEWIFDPNTIENFLSTHNPVSYPSIH
jgi:hypothetical protein